MRFKIKQNTINHIALIQLVDIELGVTIDILTRGALINSWLLRQGGEPQQFIMGNTLDAAKEFESQGFRSAKMSPFVCRLYKGQYKHLDTTYTMDRFYMGEHAIHGIMYDADFIVKLIDIYPIDEPQNADKPNVLYANYHQMVRSEIMPTRFRNSFETPIALTPNTATDITFRLQDVLHTFKKGHKIQIQIQSTCYPLFAVNPQKFLENPYLANKEDYTKAFMKILNESHIEVEIIK